MKEQRKPTSVEAQKKRVHDALDRHDRYEARQRQKATKKINRDGTIVGKKGDTGCAVTALTVGGAAAWVALRARGMV